MVGEIHSTEVEEADRDSTINRIFDIKGQNYIDDACGILILTDKNFKVLKISTSFIGKKVIYDSKTKEFTIGSIFFDYIKVGEKSFSAWQPVIVKTKIDFYANAYFVKKSYSCILTDFFVEKDEITIFCRSTNTFLDDIFSERAEVIKVSLDKFQQDTLRPWINVLEEIYSVQTMHNDIGRINLSDVQKIENNYYFTTSNLNQSTLKNANHLYRFEKDSLHEITLFPEYLKHQTKHSDWVNINSFFMKSASELTFLTHIGASKESMYFFKTDEYFDYKKPIEIPLKDYADYNKIIELSDGNVLIIAVNESKNWSYFLYNSKMEIINEIDSKISSDYYPTRIVELKDKSINCLFYIDNAVKTDCLIQEFKIN